MTLFQIDEEYDPNWCPNCGLPYGVCNCADYDYRPSDYDIGEYHDDGPDGEDS